MLRLARLLSNNWQGCSQSCNDRIKMGLQPCRKSLGESDFLQYMEAQLVHLTMISSA